MRIYFSSRERDPRNGKYLSHVCFAEFTKDFREVIRVSDRTVIELGAKREFLGDILRHHKAAGIIRSVQIAVFRIGAATDRTRPVYRQLQPFGGQSLLQL